MVLSFASTSYVLHLSVMAISLTSTCYILQVRVMVLSLASTCCILHLRVMAVSLASTCYILYLRAVTANVASTRYLLHVRVMIGNLGSTCYILSPPFHAIPLATTICKSFSSSLRYPHLLYIILNNAANNSSFYIGLSFTFNSLFHHRLVSMSSFLSGNNLMSSSV